MDDLELDKRLHTQPNYLLAKWLIDIIGDIYDSEAHLVEAATILIRCGECGQIHMRGFRDGKESSPEPLLALAVVQYAADLQEKEEREKKRPVQ